MDDSLAKQLMASGPGALMEKMGLEFLEASADRLVARIPVDGNTQPMGMFHGGASAALAETIASIGAWLHDTSKVTMGIEIKVNHLRPATKGWVTGVGMPIHTSRSIAVWEIRMSDDDGRPTAFSTATIAIREPRPISGGSQLLARAGPYAGGLLPPRTPQ